MGDLLARRWYVMALRGALAVLFGAASLLWPDITVKALAVLFGLYVLLDGVLVLGTALGGTAQKDRQVVGLEGLFDVLAGCAALVWPGITPKALLFIIAAWAVATGITEIAGALRLRRDLDREWLFACSGAVSVFAGLVLALRPGASLGAIAWLIGGYALGFGGLLIALALRLHRGLEASVSGSEKPRTAG